MKRREMLIGVVVAVLAGALLLCLPLLIERKTGSRVASAAFSSTIFPTGTLALMLLCGVGLIAQAACFTVPSKPAEPMERNAKITVLQTMAVSLAYTLLMPRLGFLASTIPCMTLVFMIFGLFSWLRGIAYSVATTLLIYAIFAVFLRVPVPTGLLI